MRCADHDLLYAQVLGDFSVAAGTRQHVGGHRIAATHRHPDDVLAAAAAEGLQVRLRHHAGVTDEQAATELPALQVGLDLGNRGHVHGIAGQHPVAHREATPGDRQANDDLRRIVAAVLAVAALARRRMLLARRRRRSVTVGSSARPQL